MELTPLETSEGKSVQNTNRRRQHRPREKSGPLGTIEGCLHIAAEGDLGYAHMHTRIMMIPYSGRKCNDRLVFICMPKRTLY